MRGIFTSSVMRDRAERQIAYRRETYLGVVQGIREVTEGSGTLTVYDVLLPGQMQPIMGVYNAAGYALSVGDGVTLNRVKGLRYRWQIIARAVGVPVDLQADNVGYWDCFDWDDGTVWG